MRRVIIPDNEQHWLSLRKTVITSTDISALFGLSPYCTPFELYHRKREGFEVEFDVNERILWGTRLQDAIAAGVAEDHKLSIRRMNEFIIDDEEKIGSSFDFSIENDGLMEVKNIDSLVFKNNWIKDGDALEATPYVEMQAQFQLMVSERKYLIIAALVGGNKVQLIKRTPDSEIIKAIKSKVAAFWKSVESNTPPSPNFEKDAKFISNLYGFAEPGKIFNAESDEEIATLVSKYKEMSVAIKQCEATKDAMKAQILMKIGDAEKVQGSGFSISAGLIGESPVSYIRKAYRDFRIFIKKEK